MLVFRMALVMFQRFFLLVAAFILISQNASSTPIFTDFNLVVGGNLASNSEVEGRTLVGGSLSGPASNYGVRLTPSAAFSDVDTLVVAGDMNAGNVNVTAGDVRVGGVVTGNVNLNGIGGELTQNSPTAGGIVASVLSQVQSFSTYIAGLATTSTVSNPAGPSAVTFNAVSGSDNVAVFNIDGSIFSDSNSQQYDLNVSSGVDAIYVNVVGKSIDFSQGNFTGFFGNPAIRPFLVWNFVDAETINLDRNWFGSILAPHASLTNSTAIDGSVFIGGDFNQRGEVHLPLLDPGVPNSPVPEPGTYALMLGSFAALGLWKRRRS